MSKNIALFPKIGEEMLKALNFKVNNIGFSYLDGTTIYPIENQIEDNYITIQDKRNIWNPKDFNLIVEMSISFENIDVLFGAKGVANKESILGLGLNCYSKASNRRKSYSIKELKYGDRLNNLIFKITLPKSSYRELINIELVIFLREGNGRKSVFASTSGTVLGELIRFSVELEGSGSEFSVFEVSRKNDPLWTLECDWVDPTVDKFSETVRILINNLHPAYALFDNDEFKTELLKEIMASAMEIIICNLDKSEYLNTDYEQGSVSQAVSYIVDRGGLNTDTYENLAADLRKYLDGVMK